MHKINISLIALAILLGGCMNQTGKSKEKVEKNNKSEISSTVLSDNLKSTLIKRGDSIAKHAQVAFQRALRAAIQSGGMEYAIGFCNLEALPITDSVSELQQANIKRLAKKNRNLLNATNEVESEIYKTYIIEWLDGKVLQPKVIPNESGHPVYYKVIRIQPLCLNCHGVPGQDITPDLAKKIVELYPEDKAINFKNGELRGMWAIEFPEYSVQQNP